MFVDPVSDKGKWAKYCSKEAMRLYPVAPFLTRKIQQESLNICEYTILQNQWALLSIYTMGRDPNNFKVLSNMLNFPVFLLNFPLLFFSGGSAETNFHCL